MSSPIKPSRLTEAVSQLLKLHQVSPITSSINSKLLECALLSIEGKFESTILTDFGILEEIQPPICDTYINIYSGMIWESVRDYSERIELMTENLKQAGLGDDEILIFTTVWFSILKSSDNLANSLSVITAQEFCH